MSVNPSEPTRTVSIEAARAAKLQRSRRETTQHEAPPAVRPRGASRARRTGDSVEVSGAGRQILEFSSAAERATARDELVKQLKTSVDAGTYQADPQAIARAMERRSEQS